MLEKASHKLHDIQGHGAPPVAFRFFILEENLVIFHLEDTAVGDSDFEDVWREVFQTVRAYSYCLRVDNPVLVPDLFRDKEIKIALSHFISELSLEDL
jgi:hypothetical protein